MPIHNTVAMTTKGWRLYHCDTCNALDAESCTKHRSKLLEQVVVDGIVLGKFTTAMGQLRLPPYTKENVDMYVPMVVIPDEVKFGNTMFYAVPNACPSMAHAVKYGRAELKRRADGDDIRLKKLLIKGILRRRAAGRSA